MLATFVVGLREGLEAALIVGIIAAFLRQRDRRDAVRLVWVGVGVAVLICAGIAVGLAALSSQLNQTAQEGVETVISLVAVAMITYMVLWMKRHSRDLKGQLENAADAALVKGSAFALVAMAFLAVLREGIETVVFLLALFRADTAPAAGGFGAALGVVIAAGIGYAIYRGGVRLNLSRFFRITGFVLVLVAAGVLMGAAHTAHEAGWVNFGQTQVLDLSWLVQAGTVHEALLTGMLGLQARPTVIEVLVWVAFFAPMATYVLWPQRRAPRPAPAPVGAPAD